MNDLYVSKNYKLESRIEYLFVLFEKNCEQSYFPFNPKIRLKDDFHLNYYRVSAKFYLSWQIERDYLDKFDNLSSEYFTCCFQTF